MKILLLSIFLIHFNLPQYDSSQNQQMYNSQNEIKPSHSNEKNKIDKNFKEKINFNTFEKKSHPNIIPEMTDSREENSKKIESIIKFAKNYNKYKNILENQNLYQGIEHDYEEKIKVNNLFVAKHLEERNNVQKQKLSKNIAPFVNQKNNNNNSNGKKFNSYLNLNDLHSKKLIKKNINDSTSPKINERRGSGLSVGMFKLFLRLS